MELEDCEITYCSCKEFRACGASQRPEEVISVVSDMCVVCADLFWWHANSAHEKLGTAVDDDIDENWQFSLGVVIAERLGKCVYTCGIKYPYLVFLAEPPTWGSNRSTPNGAFLSLR